MCKVCNIMSKSALYLELFVSAVCYCNRSRTRCMHQIYFTVHSEHDIFFLLLFIKKCTPNNVGNQLHDREEKSYLTPIKILRFYIDFIKNLSKLNNQI